VWNSLPIATLHRPRRGRSVGVQEQAEDIPVLPLLRTRLFDFE